MCGGAGDDVRHAPQLRPHRRLLLPGGGGPGPAEGGRGGAGRVLARPPLAHSQPPGGLVTRQPGELP